MLLGPEAPASHREPIKGTVSSGSQKPTEVLRAGSGNQWLSPSKRQLKKKKKEKTKNKTKLANAIADKVPRARSIWGPGDKGRRET